MEGGALRASVSATGGPPRKEGTQDANSPALKAEASSQDPKGGGGAPQGSGVAFGELR